MSEFISLCSDLFGSIFTACVDQGPFMLIIGYLVFVVSFAVIILLHRGMKIR